MYLTIIFFEIGNILYYFSIAEWFNMIFFNLHVSQIDFLPVFFFQSHFNFSALYLLFFLFVSIVREMKCSMDRLKFACSWKGNVQGARTMVKLGGLMLDGCTFDGSRLSENQRDFPGVASIPPCVNSWIPKVGLAHDHLGLPLKFA